jgi:hypothetical protein
MSFKVGDVAFGRTGEPGVVSGRDLARGELTVQTDLKEVEKFHKHGYINGLQPEERDIYQSVLDDVADIKDPEEKLVKLREKISEVEADPKQFHLLGYLKSELFHVMHLYNISPREYKLQNQF